LISDSFPSLFSLRSIEDNNYNVGRVSGKDSIWFFRKFKTLSPGRLFNSSKFDN
jgi:hypothetical protein